MMARGVFSIVQAILGIIYIQRFSIVQLLWAACEGITIFASYVLRI